MKSHTHSSGAGTAAAHRQELDPELSRGTSAAPGLADFSDGAGGTSTGSNPFGDLRRRNERRARFARSSRGSHDDLLKIERIAQLGRQRRFRKFG
jgi:hypothetical protein